ncbi:MAG: cation transporter [Deltaproteobacteria bacterium]|nr:cation transporter [Deltaproteobacteria bacterium]
MATAEERQKRAARAAVSVALGLALAKVAVGLFVNSIAVLASAMDSLLDVLASGMNLLAIRVSHAPPDQEHRFGHAKAEALATSAQALLIGGSAVYLLIEGARRIAAPQAFRKPTLALGMMLVAAAVSGILVTYMRRVARETSSSALEADATHYATDVLSNLAILVGVAFAAATRLGFLDGALTVGIALYVGAAAFRLLRGSTRVLMDHEIPAANRERILEVVRPFVGRIRAFHGLRTRSAGQRVFVELHLEMDGALPLRRAHEIGDDVEAAIHGVLPAAQVLIHLDVEEDEPPLPREGAAPPGSKTS